MVVHVIVLPPRPRPEEPDFPFVGSMLYQGITLDLEQRPGDIRSGTSPSGEEWSVTMPHFYGEVRGTTGADGDPVDVIVMSKGDPFAPFVYVIQSKMPRSRSFDETKAVLGAKSQSEAVGAFRSMYTKPGFFQGCVRWPIGAWIAAMARGGRLTRGRMKKPLSKAAEVATMALGKDETGSLTYEGDFAPVENGRFVIDISQLNDLMKGDVRAHTRRLPSGRVIQVAAHTRADRGSHPGPKKRKKSKKSKKPKKQEPQSLRASGPGVRHALDRHDAHARLQSAATHTDRRDVDAAGMWIREAKIQLGMNLRGVGRRRAKKYGYDQWLHKIEKRYRDLGGTEWPLSGGNPGQRLKDLREVMADPGKTAEEKGQAAGRKARSLEPAELRWFAGQLGVVTPIRLSDQQIRRRIVEKVTERTQEPTRIGRNLGYILSKVTDWTSSS